MRALVPLGDSADFMTASPTIMRGLFIDLADPAGTRATLASLLGQRQNPADRVEIHADVLRITKPVRLSVSSLLIHARRIEVGAGCVLGVVWPSDKPSSATSLDVYADEIALERADAPLCIEFLGVTQPFLPRDVPGHLRVTYKLDPSGSAHISSDPPEHKLAAGDALQGQMQLATAKRLAYAKSSGSLDRWKVALQMALWVNHCHSQDDGDPILAAESATLIEHLSGPHRTLPTVPALQWKTYYDLALHTAEALEHVEAQAQLFFARGQDLATQKAAATDLLAHYDGANSLSIKMRDQAKKELDDAKDAWDTSNKKLKDQQSEVEKAKTAFQAGIEKKKTEEITKAAVMGCLALLTLGIGIVSACGGNPAGVGQGLDKVGEAAQKMEKVQGIIARIRKAMEMINKILGYLEKAYKVYELVAKNVHDLKKVCKLERWEKKDVKEDKPTAADWQAFQVEMEGLFAMPIQLEVDGAQEYLIQLQKLAIRARDAIETGAQWIRCDAVYQQRLWEIERDEKDLAIVRTRLDRLGTGRPDFTMRMFYERMQDELKLSLIRSIEKIGDAYRYYALREPGHVASIEMTASALHNMVAEAEDELVRGKEAFVAPPARWTPEPWTLAALPRREAEAALARFRNEGRLSWTLSPSQFADYDRLRISEIRVWLVGKDLDERPIFIDIATSGVYADRLGDTTLEFVTAPLDRNFAYVRKDTGKDKDHLGNPVDITAWANDEEGSYFQPSPFTTWEISVPPDANPGLRLNTVADIAVQFIGSYVPKHADRRPLHRAAAMSSVRSVAPSLAVVPLKFMLL